MICEVSPLPQMSVFPSFCLVQMIPNFCLTCRFLFFSLFSVVKSTSTVTVFRTLHIDEVVKGWQDIGGDWTIRFGGYYLGLREQRQHAVRVSVWTVSNPFIRRDVSSQQRLTSWFAVEHSALSFYFWWMWTKVGSSVKSS